MVSCQARKRTKRKEEYLRKLALLTPVCAFVVFAAFAHAQQFDLAVGAGTLVSTKNTTASQIYLPPPEKGGTYVNVSLDRIFKNRFGYSVEGAFRAKQALYNYFQQYRPILYDVNALYAPSVGNRSKAIFTAGAGGQSVLFYTGYTGCYYPSGCVTHVDSNHFLVHAGAGLSYTVWRKVFVRPEVHYYHIFNNTDVFHSDNVFRAGVSVGYTFHTE